MQVLIGLLVLAAMVFAVVDIITRDSSEIRHMPKALWLFVVIFLSLLGVILWFTLGREHTSYPAVSRRMPARTQRPSTPVRQEPAVPPRPRDTRSTEQQLADLEREIEEDRLRAELRRRSGENGPERS